MNPLNLESEFNAFQFILGNAFLARFLGQYCKLPRLGALGAILFLYIYE